MEITAGLRVPSFALEAPEAWDVNTYTIPNYVSGSQVVVMPKNTVYQLTRGTNLVPTIGMLNSVSVSGSSVTFHTWWSDNWGRAKTFNSNIYQILPASSGRGLFIANSTDFTAIGNASMVGFCVWRGRITVSGSWATPSTNIARSRYQVFARWDAPGVTIEFDGSNILAYRDTGSDGDQAATVTMDVAIFASGVAPTPGPGINIFNPAGQCVFSLTKRPFVYDGFTFTPSWSSVNIGDRMVMLGRYGYYSNTNNGWAYIKWAGLIMSGGSVVCGRGKIVATWDGNYSVNGQRLTQIAVPCVANMY